MKAFEAALVLYRHGEKGDALGLLKRLWGQCVGTPAEFKVFCALLEVWAEQDAASACGFLDEVSNGDSGYDDFWIRRSMNEQANLLDWLGQLRLHLGDKLGAFDSLSRAASIGRDTSLIWNQLGALYLENGELELSLRYLRRSLQLFRQLELSFLSGREQPFGFFVGHHPLGIESGLDTYMGLLLMATKLAKSQRNLKSVRELVVEMIHQFPREKRLPRIRLMMEKAIVESSLGALAPSAQPVQAQLPRPEPRSLPSP